jgi:murein DD-endopeptidase MepM/ murein hydrolase activator NlpD
MQSKKIARNFAYKLSIVALLCAVSFVFLSLEAATALANETAEITNLNKDIDEKKDRVTQIGNQIAEYQKKIARKQAEGLSLKGELGILQNRIAQTELKIEETGVEMHIVNAQMAVIQKELVEIENKLEVEKKMIADVLRKIQVQDQQLALKLFYGNDSFSDFFNTLQYLEQVNLDLNRTLEKAKNIKNVALEKRSSRESKKNQLEELEEKLGSDKVLLASEVGASQHLIVQTKNSEKEFQNLLQELKQEQAYINQQVAAIQKEIEGKLDKGDDAGGSSVMSWPFDPEIKGISATYHDKTYPFRHLFEHSGIDLPARTGTKVGAAAPGYVAWARKGRLYGNYIMIIHTNGMATLYAHLNSMNVSADQFVERGQKIGEVGSTGFSTGPHLHFEVRKNGIPTNPLNYLMNY